MIARFIIWIIQKIYTRKLRKAFGSERLVAVHGLLNNYSCMEQHKKTKNRATYIKEFKSIGIISEEFLNELIEIHSSMSSHLHITDEVYLAIIFIRTCLKDSFDLRKPDNQKTLDKLVSDLDYLVFNYKL
jgi:hypothetical protein